jgi:hypothetical protein
MKSRPAAERPWAGHIAVIVGSGPSAITAPLELLRHRAKIVVVNESWKLAPWADALFACDEAWWDANDGLPEFSGRRFTASPRCKKQYGIELFCSTGTNSGLRAIYLAENLGANPIYLIGFEMHPKNGVHWHKPYERLRNPGQAEMRRWMIETEWAYDRFRNKGVRVFNCTPGSALKKYPHVTLEQVIIDGVGSSSSAIRERSPAPVG